ncbi:MFS general substrate transporter [Ganoderma sinense ZZ0214-1]|uniref:MFS general substrate transporter n=1 Tax=Ganoderma sinense ZZ0214-1 TaxID=1077348 RepID=A0A2G8S5Q4_9APHY|nr:MFS general substrate transporter [Ganoderma sinense ZZ0214-1]
MSIEKVPTNVNDKGKDTQQAVNIEDDGPHEEISEAIVVAEGEERTTMFVWLLVFCTSISGLLFGYDTGVISGALELITSSTTLDALLGGMVAGMLGDFLGRKPVLGIADVIFIGGAIGQAVCHTVWSMIGGRFLIGVGVGIAACVAPPLHPRALSHTSPGPYGSRKCSCDHRPPGHRVWYRRGIREHARRVEVDGRAWGCSGWPTVHLPVFFFLPESPRIMIKRQKLEVARAIMAKIYAHATPEQIDLKVKSLAAAVKHSVEISENTTLLQRIHLILFNGVNRRALIVACGLQAFQQLCGFNTLTYYSATLFKEIGFDQPTAVSLIVAGTNFLFTLFALKYIDTIGRRKIMVWTAPSMVFGLVLAAVAFHFLTKRTGGNLVDGTQYSHT